MRNIIEATVGVVLITVIVIVLALGCAAQQHRSASERIWREGDAIHYTDGYDYHVWADLTFPHYHIVGGRYVETFESSETHYHRLINPKGPADYILCYAEHHDGQWFHKPQWHHKELERERKRR